MINDPDDVIGAALGYARCGWPVFPCRPGAKEPATRHGFRDASTDAGQIRHWWHRQPGANVAIATGWPGPDVLDVDYHGRARSGFPAWNQLKSTGLATGASMIVATQGGGLHAYFAGSRQVCGRLPHITWTSAPSAATCSPRHRRSTASPTVSSSTAQSPLA